MLNNFNKVAILLHDSRQIDYYLNFVSKIDYVNFIFIVNDRDIKSFNEITSILSLKEFEHISMSDALNFKKKYAVILSTGNFTIDKKNFKLYMNNLFKFIYARSLGALLITTKLDILFVRFLGRTFSAGGAKRKLVFQHREYPERLLGENTVYFPRGMDFDFSTFPSKSLIKRFDYFFCHSSIDKELVLDKSNRKAVIIGYPRYDNLPDYNLAKKNLIDEFILNKHKPLVLWMPSRLDCDFTVDHNVIGWLPFVNKLSDSYNVILRPHPHLIKLNPKLKPLLDNTKLNIDYLEERSLSSLYAGSDVILCDYGGSIFSALYCNKKIALLKSESHKKCILNINKCEIDLRNLTPSCDLENGEGLLKIVDKLYRGKYNNTKSRNIVFGNKSKQDSENGHLLLQSIISSSKQYLKDHLQV